MEYKIERNSKKLTAEILHSLRISVGWPSNVNNCENELTYTYSNFSAWSDSICVGYANSISDGVSDALINNLMVPPQFQNQGIGTKLIQTLIAELRNDGVKFFNIVFEPRLGGFYKKLGFKLLSAGIMDFYDLSESVVPDGWQGVKEKL